MKAFTKYFAFVAMALGLSLQCFAESNICYAQPQTCDNYYIQPGGVYLTPNGIYASIDGLLIQINTLCADDRGIFVPFAEIAGRLVQCPFCRKWYDPEKGHSNCPGFPE